MNDEDTNLLRERVYTYNTKYREGFLAKEVEDLLKMFPGIDRDKFDEALQGITCMTERDGLIIYHTDIFHALLCGIEARDLKNDEWD